MGDMLSAEQHPIQWAAEWAAAPRDERDELLLGIATTARAMEEAHPRHLGACRTREDDSAHLEALGELEEAVRAARLGKLEDARAALARARKALL